MLNRKASAVEHGAEDLLGEMHEDILENTLLEHDEGEDDPREVSCLCFTHPAEREFRLV
jgi:hypothetical protein